MEQTGQKKGRRKKSRRFKEREEKERAKRAAKREAENKERLRKWEECWERKYQAQEDRDYAECCVDKGLCMKPRTQSNIWINVTQDKSIQEIQMTLKHVPVPKPKPPPLPPLWKQKALDKASVQRVDKKSGTKKKKKKN
ncbi:unnamed protein product [Xylocopa violacea]|uniref:Uncharacterized protein n=1 Tax=Xylocopa violacea TaxID=135666 RepID=A0ABP1N541_XYLVO